MDNISELPDVLLVKILSFVPTKVAVSTCVLSKRWEFLWMWLPKLEFITELVYGIEKPGVNHIHPKPGIVDFIDKKLPLHRAPVIESLLLHFHFDHINPEDIKRWIDTAVSRYVRELEIDYKWIGFRNIHPSSFLICTSLVILKLKYGVLVDVSSMVCLPSLKTLQLKKVNVGDGESLQQLLSGCPVLEDLSVNFYWKYNMKEFTIIVPSLQSLSLCIPAEWIFDGYEIDTPSVKYLKLKDFNKKQHYSLIKNMPKLREAYVIAESSYTKSLIIGSITSVKHLTICAEDVYGNGFVFNQLEHLNLCVHLNDSSKLLGKLLQDSPKLRVLDILVIKDHWDAHNNFYMAFWNQPSHVPECLLSSLQILKWSRYFGRPEERDIAVYMLKNARHLKTATILADSVEHGVPNLQMIKELTLSPRASSTCQLVFV